MPLGTEVNVCEETISLKGWPTNVVSIDLSTPHAPNTILLFVCGNPGCVGWYTRILSSLVQRLGGGYAARGVSHAGHSPDETLVTTSTGRPADNRDSSIPWTVDGQVDHKICYVDHVLNELTSKTGSSPRFIFLSHSIGSHMVERMLMLRPDVLARTIGLLHIMPYTRMKSFPFDQRKLDFGAASPEVLVTIASGMMRILRFFPKPIVDSMGKSVFEDEDGRRIAVQLLRQPAFAGNFFWLGTEELRDVPQVVDAASLRTIGRHCRIKMLYCGQDQWGPEFHTQDLQELQGRNVIPQNISISYMANLRHDFVSSEVMVPAAIDWCFDSIQEMLRDSVPRSRL